MSQQPQAARTSWLLPAAAHALILGGMLGRLVVSGPRYRKTFMEYNMDLPALTNLVNAVSSWLSLYWYVAVIFAVGLIVADALLLVRLGGLPTRRGRLWAWGVAGSLLSLWVAAELAWLIPMMKLLEALDR